MLGTFAVGKSSLIRRFVTGVFDASYQSTVGVKIDTCQIELQQQSADSPADPVAMKMLLWDLAGEAELNTQSKAYITGMQGYILVADGTRKDTLFAAERIQQQVNQTLGKLPFVMLINKHDLYDQWQVPDTWLEQHRDQGWQTYCSSALSGESVAEAFHYLAHAMYSNTTEVT